MAPTLLNPEKFQNQLRTLDGQARATVELHGLHTLWFNTGTLCNITCAHCYIESSPTNDRLEYLCHDEMTRYLDEIRDTGLPTSEIGFTGGEPFMNPDILPMLQTCLARGFRVLVLTNAMQPMQRPALLQGLHDLRERFADRLSLRVSLDHHTKALHETERGANTWDKALAGITYLLSLIHI